MGAYVDSEVGHLETVLLHRPGRELARLTPRNSNSLLFDGLPWLARAQQEHDIFADALRENGVEVLYLSDLLVETLTLPAASTALVAATLVDARLGDALRGTLREHLEALDIAALAEVLISGLAHEEHPRGNGLVYQLLNRHDFVLDPLPNLVFTRDSSFWVGAQPAVASPAMRARRRESTLMDVIYRYHPRFAGTTRLYEPQLEHLEGGDVLLLAPGVIAVGVGERTRPAGAERLAQRCFARGLARAVVVVPITQRRATMHLDTVCTMVDTDAVLMYPNIAHSLTAWTLTAGDDTRPRLTGPTPFLAAAADAMGIDTLRIIDTGLDPVTAEREQWDDGNNTLAIAPRLCVAYERNVETNIQLERAGVRVVRIPGSELGSGRGGPRCMSCPIRRTAVSEA